MPRSSRLEDKYNNTISGLNATTFQQAIDEIVQNTSEVRYFITNLSGSVSNLGLGTQSMIIGKSSSISTIDEVASDNIIIGNNSNLSSSNGRFFSNITDNIIIGNNAFIKAANNSIQLGAGTLSSSNSLGFLNNIIATDKGLFTSFQPTVYNAINDDVIDDHLIGIHSKFQNININELTVPAQTEMGSVIFYDGTSLNSTTSLLLDENFCSVATIDDRGYDWCNWQIGNNGSAFTSSKKSLGTKANPTPITAGTKIGGWGFVGDDGVTPSQGSPGYVGAEVSAFALGDQNSTNGGTRLQVDVTPENTKSRTTILTTDDQGRFVLPTISTSGEAQTALYVDPQGILQQGTIPAGATVLDENDLASESTTQAPSQSSVKTYIDNKLYRAIQINISAAQNGTDYDVSFINDGEAVLINFVAPAADINFTRNITTTDPVRLSRSIPFSYTRFSGDFTAYVGQKWIFTRFQDFIRAELIQNSLLDSTGLVENSPRLPASQRSVKEFVEDTVEANIYSERSINASRAISINELGLPGKVTRYRVLSGLTLTPPSGFRFVPWNPNTSNYEGLATDADFITDNLKNNVYDLFYFNNDIYITNQFPYSKTLIRAISNNASDAAINYNTTNWQAVTFSDPSSIVRVSNRYPITLTNNTFTPNYTGWFNVGHNLHIRSTGQRCHLVARIINTTTNEVIIVTDYTYIRAASGQNLDTLKLGSLDVPCVAGQNYQLQIKRQGNVTNSATLDNATRSSLTIKSATF